MTAERPTLARQLHDGPLQSATALDLRLQLLVLRHPDDADAVAALSAAEGLVADLRELENRLRQTDG
jgi:signal transduction histidine kinase